MPTPTAPGGSSLGRWRPGGGISSEWDEMLRYLRLLMAVQAEGAPSWGTVQRCAERLCERGRAAAREMEIESAAGTRGEVEKEVAQVRARRDALGLKAEALDADMSEAVKGARELQRECDQLTFQISLEREAQENERKRMVDHSNALASEVQRDEAKLDSATSQVQLLRAQVLQQDGLERWQVEKVEALQQEILDIREAIAQNAAKCSCQRARLDAAQAERQRLLGEAGRATGPEVAPAVPPQTGGLTAAARRPRWDEARSAMERLREQFQVAVHQARATIGSS